MSAGYDLFSQQLHWLCKLAMVIIN